MAANVGGGGGPGAIADTLNAGGAGGPGSSARKQHEAARAGGMVDRVAQTIEARMSEDTDIRAAIGYQLGIADPLFMEKVARAVIEAMIEPTDEMGLGLPADYRPGSHSATQIWKAMMLKALE